MPGSADAWGTIARGTNARGTNARGTNARGTNARGTNALARTPHCVRTARNAPVTGRRRRS
ncbi:pentapeptide repeat-containing protein [Paraburkholderia phenoliruptrix]|uniref:pentapeptide repeat-containing protein n=1 Tax=Paraburkholderia phenoliruptrix TaxID=252970 RepID=UPI0035B569E2